MPSASRRFELEVARIRHENPNMPPMKIIDRIRSESPSLYDDFSKEVSGGSSPTPKTEKARKVHAESVAGISASRRFQILMEKQMKDHGVGSHEAFHLTKLADPELYKQYCDGLGYEEPEGQTQDTDSVAA